MLDLGCETSWQVIQVFSLGSTIITNNYLITYNPQPTLEASYGIGTGVIRDTLGYPIRCAANSDLL